ncbi:unnamed protein product [Dovyalis caffra]|uniref:Uncharacterized protein n=1 Tax=Dovyalis caffra TaxID=77055 RepID=A0AAV1QUE9_9ROSI|nr:unnamed protein product [Dovyalis caffra]
MASQNHQQSPWCTVYIPFNKLPTHAVVGGEKRHTMSEAGLVLNYDTGSHYDTANLAWEHKHPTP